MRHRFDLPAMAAALLLLATSGFAQSPADAQVKARVALAIARFAQLPVDVDPGPLLLCVAAEGPLSPALAALSGQKVGGHSVAVHAGPPFPSCHLVYVDESYGPWRQLLGGLPAGALTMGDAPGFLAAGGMVEFVLDNDAVRFDVNLAALRDQDIRLPAQVLKLARRVKD